MFSQLTFFLILTILFLLFILYTTLNKTNKKTNVETKKTDAETKKTGVEKNATKVLNQGPVRRAGPVPVMYHKYVPKWDNIFREVEEFKEGLVLETGMSKGQKKRAKKRAALAKEAMVCVYPFSKPLGPMQRNMKKCYDELVKAYVSKKLKREQVEQFENCLVEAEKELDERLNALERKLIVIDALVLKAEPSSHGRLRKQMGKLELEQKWLEEDTFVYEWLQDQLKDSPAYKKMLEISASVEKKEESISLLESEDSDFSDMSFEELLEQEKKDSFWKKNGKLKLCSG